MSSLRSTGEKPNYPIKNSRLFGNSDNGCSEVKKYFLPPEELAKYREGDKIMPAKITPLPKEEIIALIEEHQGKIDLMSKAKQVSWQTMKSWLTFYELMDELKSVREAAKVAVHQIKPISSDKPSRELIEKMIQQGVGRKDIASYFSYKLADLDALVLEYGLSWPGQEPSKVPLSEHSNNVVTLPEQQQTTMPQPKPLTIAQAIAFKDELEEDIDCIDELLKVAAEGAQITPRIIELLKGEGARCHQQLEKLNNALNSTVINF